MSPGGAGFPRASGSFVVGGSGGRGLSEGGAVALAGDRDLPGNPARALTSTAARREWGAFRAWFGCRGCPSPRRTSLNPALWPVRRTSLPEVCHSRETLLSRLIGNQAVASEPTIGRAARRRPRPPAELPGPETPRRDAPRARAADASSALPGRARREPRGGTRRATRPRRAGACVGRWELFDEIPGGELADPNAAATALCGRCPVLDACRAWVTSLPAHLRPSGVVAGQLHQAIKSKG